MKFLVHLAKVIGMMAVLLLITIAFVIAPFAILMEKTNGSIYCALWPILCVTIYIAALSYNFED